MRLFLFFFIFSLISPSLSGSSYLPLPITNIITGRAILLEDISSESRRGSFQIIDITSDLNIIAGARYKSVFIIPTCNQCHYKGEIVELNLYSSNQNKLKIHNLVFYNIYHRKSSFMRAKIISFIREKLEVLGEPGNMLEALLLGKTDRLQRASGMFREAGVSHLLALSGLHRGIITGLLVLILRPFIPRRYLGVCIIFILCWYTWLIGTKHSLIRAMIMYGLFVLSDILHIKPSIGKILLCSLIIQVVLWRDCYQSLSFQLSYLAMGGIILFTYPCSLILKRIMPSPVALVLSVSISAQLALIPLLLTVFGEVHLWGIIAGVFLTPLITIYIWLGITMLPFILTSSKLLGVIEPLFDFIYQIIIKIVIYFAPLPVILRDEWSGRLLFFLSIFVMIAFISLFLVKESDIVRKNLKIKLRLPIRNKIPSGNDGFGPQKTMGTELSHKSGSKTADSRPS